jgi:hypothetical protein
MLSNCAVLFKCKELGLLIDLDLLEVFALF